MTVREAFASHRLGGALENPPASSATMQIRRSPRFRWITWVSPLVPTRSMVRFPAPVETEPLKEPDPFQSQADVPRRAAACAAITGAAAITGPAAITGAAGDAEGRSRPGAG